MDNKNTLIVIPAHNEWTESVSPYEDNIGRILSDTLWYGPRLISTMKSNIYRTLYVLSDQTKIPILVINNWSTDDTQEEIFRFTNEHPESAVTQLKIDKAGKWKAFLASLDNLPDWVKRIILTDGDMVLPNWFDQNLLWVSSSQLSMIIHPALALQDLNWRDEPTIVDLVSWTRLIDVESIWNHMKSYWIDDARMLIGLNKYWLEAALNLIVPENSQALLKPQTNRRYLNDYDYPQFLPWGRVNEFENMEFINEDIIATEFMHIQFQNTK